MRLEGGKVVSRDVLTVQTSLRSRAGFLVDLGLETTAVEANGMVIGDALTVDAMSQTAVPGVFAAGNVTEPMAQVVMAAAGGLKAGSVINADLIREETGLALAARGS